MPDTLDPKPRYRTTARPQANNASAASAKTAIRRNLATRAEPRTIRSILRALSGTVHRADAPFVAEGNRIFHDARALDGTVRISCDMYHPNAANTHAETYPKYQVHLHRAALLRDMINWCIENPPEGSRWRMTIPGFAPWRLTL